MRAAAGRIAITGATGGLGRALALAYARPGVRLALSGRDAERLEAVVGDCRARGAAAAGAAFDVRDGARLAEWLADADREAPLDLVVANAGVSAANGADSLESPEDTRRLLDVDATAAIATARAAAGLMLPRGAGRIALVSSLAALQPLASSPSYCAAKAAVRMYGLALGEWLRPRGVRVTVVCPGYVRTPMSDRLEGPKPFLWTAEKAAAHIRQRLESAPAEVAFPWSLAWGLRLLSCCPRFARKYFTGAFAFTVRSDGESTGSGQ